MAPYVREISFAYSSGDLMTEFTGRMMTEWAAPCGGWVTKAEGVLGAGPAVSGPGWGG
jgi:hypothetical protein